MDGENYSISRENWLQSKKKWEKIIEKTRDGHRFTSFGIGFEDLVVVTDCGYCKEFKQHCAKCVLATKRLCYWTEISVAFWHYVSLMCKGKPKKALPHAEKILSAILEDKARVR